LIAKEFGRRKCNIDLVKSAVDSSSLLGLCASVRADVVLTNARLRDGPRAGYRIIQELRKTSPKTHIVVTLDSVDRQQVIDAFRNGAHGVVSGDDSFAVLCKCIEAVVRGEIWASRRELYYVLDALSAVPPSRIATVGGSNALTRREEDVVRLVAEARTNREISEQLMLSPNTVRNYLFRIFDKTGVSNRIELVLRALHREEAE
jgi:DNA-binding NarL/FixJ family response regulator